MRFGERLAGLLVERGLTQVRLARRLHTSQATISRWLTGESMPRAGILRRLAEEMGVRYAWLLDGEGARNEDRIYKYDPQIKKLQRPFAKRPSWRRTAGESSAVERDMQGATELQKSVRLFVRDLRDDQLFAKMHETLDDSEIAPANLILILRVLVDELDRRYSEPAEGSVCNKPTADAGATDPKNPTS